MEIVTLGNNLCIKNINDFVLSQTLECGQCFHFKKIRENEYGISAYGRMLHIKQDENGVFFYNTSQEEFEAVWKHYFDFENDYGKIKEVLLQKDNKLKPAIETMWGVRILNQEFFETLISFIISQNKQIPHIKQIVEAISKKYGNYLGEIEGIEFYSFPGPEVLLQANEDDIRTLKTGFRAPYIVDAVRLVTENIISADAYSEMTSTDTINHLQQIKGVGAKVASCVALFSLGKRDAFPIDVWIKRIMEHMYYGKETAKEEIALLATDLYGEYGGYAQQYLFYFGKEMKMGKEEKERKREKNK